MGPIFLEVTLARALFSLGRPHSWFPYLMLTMCPALTASVTLGAFPTLATFVALTALTTLATHPSLAVHPVQFSLPCFVTPGNRTFPVTVFVPFMLGMFPDGGIIGISLWRGPGSFVLFSIKRGGLSFGYSLIETLFAGGPSPLPLQMAAA